MIQITFIRADCHVGEDGGGLTGNSVLISVRVKELDIFLQNVKTFSRCVRSSKTETFGHNVEIFS